eukprot:TRINITY_DN72516_c0_g2_i1.p4 TRINITY_DN72516_c0_g2~~TRINITY_DN72516_c0_g2_i1.p4  ORF type:complete len:117 (+),score=23.95 TRINITY_DN72516_c0_g2_i1:196-546(+)
MRVLVPPSASDDTGQAKQRERAWSRDVGERDAAGIVADEVLGDVGGPAVERADSAIEHLEVDRLLEVDARAVAEPVEQVLQRLAIEGVKADVARGGAAEHAQIKTRIKERELEALN